MDTKRILCVCKGNTCRSPVIEGMLRDALEKSGIENVTVESAGIEQRAVGRPANPHSIACMKQHGIDITAHKGRCVEDLDLSGYHLIVVATPEIATLLAEQYDRLNIMVTNPEEGGIADPSMNGPVAYDLMVEAVTRAIPEVMARL